MLDIVGSFASKGKPIISGFEDIWTPREKNIEKFLAKSVLHFYSSQYSRLWRSGGLEVGGESEIKLLSADVMSREMLDNRTRKSDNICISSNRKYGEQ